MSLIPALRGRGTEQVPGYTEKTSLKKTKNLLSFVFLIYVYRYFVCILICVPCVFSVHGGPKRALNTLELVVMTFVS